MTFDFYETLVYHRTGIGRGGQYMDYLAAAGFDAEPWEHQVLYDVFEYYAAAYHPTLTDEAKAAFWTEFTRRLFERTRVRASAVIDHAAHAPAIRAIMGPDCLALFDEALEMLGQLRKAGLRLGVISDWQKGLRHFCDELGLGSYMDVIVSSAEEGYQKPDPRLFDRAREQMSLPAREILHVGDRVEDVDGAHAAGFSAVLLVRGADPAAVDAPVIQDLRGLLALV